MNLTQDTIAFKGSNTNAKFALYFDVYLFLNSTMKLFRLFAKFIVILVLFGFVILQASGQSQPINPPPASQKFPVAKPSSVSAPSNQSIIKIEVGAENTDQYLPLIRNKRVGIIANQTSTIGKQHLVDSLLRLGIKIVMVFAPEHGFRGDAANGAHIENGIDAKTGLPIVSLYGKNSKPSKSDLSKIDVLLFDIQDVGTRFYTFLTTLHYAMQACSEFGKPIILLDRPNPNGFYIDGPILKHGFESMVGVYPIPIVHGMTLAELAQMINGEGWLKDSMHPKIKSCKLTVIKCNNYNHNRSYELPIPPSPNLPNQNAIYLYPTLCLFEGSNMISVGRGTNKPFECFGAPWMKQGTYSFCPKNIPGKALNPPFLGDTCRGVLLNDFAQDFLISYNHLYIEWLVMLYDECQDQTKFFNAFFPKLAGSNLLQEQIKSGLKPSQIRQSWQDDIDRFIKLREPYLLYPFNASIGLY